LFKRRQTGDYRDFIEFKKEDVEKWISKAKEFVGKVEKITLKILEGT